MVLRRSFQLAAPWLILLSTLGVAAWHVVDFSEAGEVEFPRVPRPFFNRYPPAAYRLAEPGDTLDRVGLYLATGALACSVVAVASRLRSGRESLSFWPSALALALASTWHAATPGPTFDGWHGLGWRSSFDPVAPIGLRIALAVVALGLLGVILANIRGQWSNRSRWLDRTSGIRGLLAASAVLVLARQAEIPGVEPVGYWPRVAFDLGMLGFGMALIRARPIVEGSSARRPILAIAGFWAVVVGAGVGVSTFHRPLARLRAVVPGKIYISAMPTYRGLAIEQDRLHFRTIINLFDEASTQGSPRYDEEIRFVRERGLRYLGSPSDGLESDRFLDETLALAQNPEAWPILVHCHGCMDRSPAWMGIYRFLVEGKPLAEVFAEIERHRGSRPKAVVTLQYNRKIPTRAPERFDADPTGRAIRRGLAGIVDPFLRPNWNSTATSRRVVTRIEPNPALWRR
jgi:hypothetical protein